MYKTSFNNSEENNLGLTDLIGDHIYDHVIDGVECQVISPDDFFDCLSKYGIRVENESERTVVQRVLKLTSTDQNWYFVNNLVTILSSLGIREHVPEDTPFLKYSNLKGRDIRIINRLNFISDKYRVKDLRKIFSKVIFTQKVVSLKQNSKERVIELCHADNFLQVLQKLKVTNAIELEENLLNLLALSPDKTELIMMDKVIKV